LADVVVVLVLVLPCAAVEAVVLVLLDFEDPPHPAMSAAITDAARISGTVWRRPTRTR